MRLCSESCRPAGGLRSSNCGRQKQDRDWFSCLRRTTPAATKYRPLGLRPTQSTNSSQLHLERKPYRQNCIVIVGVEVCGGDLIAAADGESDSVPKVKPSDYEAWGYEVLLHSVARAVLKKG